MIPQVEYVHMELVAGTAGETTRYKYSFKFTGVDHVYMGEIGFGKDDPEDFDPMTMISQRAKVEHIRMMSDRAKL